MRSVGVIRHLAVVIALSTPLSLAHADTYKIDPVHSSILYRVKHFGASYSYGRFNDCSGHFTIDDTNPSADRFDLTVKVDSLDSNNKNRDTHLKSPDFFNAKEFPAMTFKSTQVQKIDDQNLDVQGDLTIHGVTRPVTFRVERTGVGKDPRGNVRAGLETVLTIKRSDYGMNFMLQGVGDDVRIIVSLEGVRQK
jgi:polyisoprenoid-binding protein YceI